MNELQVFNNEAFGTVRVIERDGEPWFVGKDVADILGYTNSRKALIDHVDDEDKGVTKCDTLGGAQEITVINESGLYSLVLQSKLPKAKAFKHWVTSEVLPSIRKHGAYMTPETIEKVLLNPDTMIKLCTQLKEEQAKRREAERQIEENRPKVLFADAVSTSKTNILVGELAKILKQNGIETGEKRLFQWLRNNGYLMRRQGTDWNAPTQKSMELGLFEIKETVINHPDGHTTIKKTTKITAKGQLYFINKFLSDVGATA